MGREKLVGITSDKLFYHNHREKRKMETADFYRKTRLVLLDMLGNKCKRCGFDDPRALQIDHIKGGGVRERRVMTRMYNVVVRESLQKGELKYQLLCANCNWIKRYELKEDKKIAKY